MPFRRIDPITKRRMAVADAKQVLEMLLRSPLIYNIGGTGLTSQQIIDSLALCVRELEDSCSSTETSTIP